MKAIKFFIPLVIFLGLAVFFGLSLDKNPSLLPSALLNKPVPAFSAPQLDSEQFINQDQLKGEVSLLNIWATWCVPCRQEHDALMEIATEDVKIYGLNYKDEPSKAKQWLVDLDNPYQAVILDPAGQIAIEFGVYGVPETYIIDRKGIIRYRFVGILTLDIWQTELKPLVRKLYAE